MNTPSKSNKLPVAIFASGNGTNFEAITKANLPIDIKLLVCDHADVPVLKRAARLGVPALTIVSRKGLSKAQRETIILRHLKVEGVKAIFLAGYMKIVGPTLLNVYDHKILNIHPALLPKFKGRHGIEDAFKAKVPYSGVTIHYIDSGIDSGPIIAQQKVKRLPSDTLHDFAMRIHHTEHQLYPHTIMSLIKKGVL